MKADLPEDRVISLPETFKAHFIRRNNRFLGTFEVPGDENKDLVEAHIRDSGRLGEILFEGNKILLTEVDDSNRKTNYEVIAGRSKGNREWVLINTRYHPRISKWVINRQVIPLFEGVKKVRSEETYGESRLDFLLFKEQQNVYMEVKGCTLAREGKALFPDAPTKRGTKHLRSLIKAKQDGYGASLLMLVFRPGSICFLPNKDSDEKFYDTFFRALERGIEVNALKFSLSDDSIFYEGPIDICGG